MILTMLASDRSTVTPWPPHQSANRRTRHHPPADDPPACPALGWSRIGPVLLALPDRPQCFALEPTEEVASSLFSDVRDGGPVHQGGRHFSPAGETVARSTPGAHAAAAILISACLPPTPLHRCIGLRVRALNDPHDARLRPFNRHTLEPAAASRTDASVTIRLLIPTPAQRVSLI